MTILRPPAQQPATVPAPWRARMLSSCALVLNCSLAAFLPLPCLSLFSPHSLAQTPSRPPFAAPSSPIEQAIDLASKGRCEEALPLLKQHTPRVADKQLKYRALMATMRCALNRREDQTAANALFDLKRDFPEDPEVLYMTTQFFLEIATRASQELVATAPNSVQAREMKAEALESQNKWEDAAAIYRNILEENPKLRGIHFRLASAAISKPDSPASVQEAKKEFQEELAIDPVNAAAEYWLGKIAGSEGDWDTAISHFASAAKIDPNFAEAFLSLGTALNAQEHFEEAIPPLERYTRMSANDPAGHFQLARAYARTGRKEDSVRELTIQRELFAKEQAEAAAKAGAVPH